MSVYKTIFVWFLQQIAGIFEFLGAMVLGGETTKTVATDIANMNMFADAPDVGFSWFTIIAWATYQWSMHVYRLQSDK